MAKRANYGFEKRQKEIKKQQKRDAKLEKKQQKKDAATQDDAETSPAPATEINHDQG